MLNPPDSISIDAFKLRNSVVEKGSRNCVQSKGKIFNYIHRYSYSIGFDWFLDYFFYATVLNWICLLFSSQSRVSTNTANPFVDWWIVAKRIYIQIRDSMRAIRWTFDFELLIEFLYVIPLDLPIIGNSVRFMVGGINWFELWNIWLVIFRLWFWREIELLNK